EPHEPLLPGATRPFGLVDAGGVAYLVDGNGPAVDTLEGSSAPQVDHGGCLSGPLTPDAVLGGSADGDTRVVVAIDGHAGTVHYSDLVAKDCMSTVIKNAAGARFGTPVEAAGLIYVPVVST